MNTTTVEDAQLAAAAREFLSEAMALTADFGEPVRSAVRAAAHAPLPDDAARELYTSVLTMLAEAKGETDDGDLGVRIADEVDAIMSRSPREVDEEDDSSDEIELIAMHGLEPREVMPVPRFLDQPIALQEGYVDVLDLPLWVKNDRVQLEVAEFEQRNGRLPNQEELLLIMTGNSLLPSMAKADPFTIRPLANSIARRGVERAPIITAEGEPKDGNRRIAACKYILENPDKFDEHARQRARYIRVWKAPRNTTEDQFEAIVVALNFEDDYKESWAEFIKARKVFTEYERRVETIKGSLSDYRQRKIKQEIAERFSIKTSEVTRYIKMVTWANDFESYHVDELARDEHQARYRTNDIFQWFYEIDAGKGGEKLTQQIEGGDDELRSVVYDLMWDTIDSGRLVRGLHKVIAEDEGFDVLKEARDLIDEDQEQALQRIREVVTEAELQRKKRLGLQAHVRAVRAAIDKLGSTAPDKWREFEVSELHDLEFAFESALGAIRAELKRRASEDAG